MKQIPFLTIIIPTYNCELTLKKSLESIFNQTYTNFEVLIIDGVSNDNTLNIAKQFNDTRLKISSEKDKGIYDAMNKGIKLAKGKWMYFMGSDDSFYEVNTLEKVFNFKAFNTSHVVYGNVTSPRFNGVYAGEFTYSKLANQNICHQAIFFKKKLFNLIGDYNLKYKAHADWEHNIKWFYNSKIKNAYIDIIVANYADGGFSSNGDALFKKDKKLVLRKNSSCILRGKNFYKCFKSKIFH